MGGNIRRSKSLQFPSSKSEAVIKFTILLILNVGFFYISLSGQITLINSENSIYTYGGIERFDTTQKVVFLTFTGGDFGEGTKIIRNSLHREQVPASFFFTGDFYRLKSNRRTIRKLIKDGHYLGAHSDQHLLYVAWENRDSLLISKEVFMSDLLRNYAEMENFGLNRQGSPFFMPPFEWYNDSISKWTNEFGCQLINFTPGTRSNADYTTPDMGSRYVDSATIMQSIFEYEDKSGTGLNGFILLLHVGTDPKRTDKFYHRLPELLYHLDESGYRFLSLKSVLNGN